MDTFYEIIDVNTTIEQTAWDGFEATFGQALIADYVTDFG